jgi:dethiobiotin synthetase
VTRPTLGTINHTLLTVKAARSFGLKVAGLVVNHHAPLRRGLPERLNPAVLETETGVPVLATLPYLGDDPARASGHAIFQEIASRLNGSRLPADII